MPAYLRAFINFEQNIWTKLLAMAEFTYCKTKKTAKIVNYHLS